MAEAIGNIPRGTISSSSEADFDLACQPCGCDGNNVEAEGYCRDCCAYLCSRCIRYHRNLASNTNHELLDKKKMPKASDAATVRDVCTTRCQKHSDEVIKFYCPTHRFLGCAACVNLSHKICPVIYIPEESVNIEQNRDYNNFKANLKTLMERTHTIIRSSTGNLVVLADHYKNVLDEIEAYRREITSELNEMANRLNKMIEQIKEQDTILMNSVIDKCKDVQQNLLSTEGNTESLFDRKQYCQLYTDMKLSERNLEQFKDKLDAMDNAFLTSFKFQPGEELEAVCHDINALGRIVQRNPSETKLSYATDINIKAHSIRKSTISGMAMLSKDRLVLVDTGNDTVKLVDTVEKKVLSELTPEQYPWDVTTITDKAAVTLPLAQKIIFLGWDNVLAYDREINVNGICWGIDHVNGTTIVTYTEPTKVEIMNISGEVLHTFLPGNRLPSLPRHVAIHPLDYSVFLADSIMHRVVQISRYGTLESEYEVTDLAWPGHVAIDKMGITFICGEGSNNVHQIITDCISRRVLEDSDGMKQPRALCYCEETDRLYVGMCQNNTVKVYHVQ